MGTSTIVVGDKENDMKARVRSHVMASIETKERVLEQCVDQIVAAAELMARVLVGKNKVMLCGNGGSAADSQHIAAELVSVLNQEFLRPGLSAIALTTDSSILTASANDFGFDGIFERQVQALGLAGDVLVGISTSGNSENVIRAMKYAVANNIHTIALVGHDGGKLAQLADHAIIVPSNSVQNIQEAHITIGHIVCGLAESIIFPNIEE